MRRLGWLGIFVFFSNAGAVPNLQTQTALVLNSGPQVVRVRLSGLGRNLRITGTDLQLALVKNPALGTVASDEWSVDCKTSRIVHPKTKKSRMIPRSGIFLQSLSGIFSINGKRFHDQLVIYPKNVNASECSVVNHLALEKYLASVVNSEFNSKWADHAVEAQIIAARTYALYQVQEKRRDSTLVYDLESTEKDQVYHGLDVADHRAVKLVQKTQGLILSDGYSKKTPIKAFYHSTCGGRTLLPEQVWGVTREGFKNKPRCPYCVLSPVYRWKHEMSLGQIEVKLNESLKSQGQSPALWKLTSLEFLEQKEKHAAPNPKKMKFVFKNRDRSKVTYELILGAYAARLLLGAKQIKSTAFQMKSLTGQKIEFRGKGAGHGVGMCQWGAKRMGELGFSTQKILSQYYPDAHLNKVW